MRVCKMMKYLALIAILMLTACGPTPSQSDLQPLEDLAVAVNEAKTSEYYMSYNVNGQKTILDSATVKTFRNGTGFSLDGENTMQGDLTAVRVFPTSGEVKPQSYTATPGGLVFSLTQLGSNNRTWETWATYDIANLSLGEGTLTFTEVTDTYVKGTFSFIANVGEPDGPAGHFEVTDGHFKARIVNF